MQKTLLLFSFCIFLSFNSLLFAQNEVLFTVGDTKVKKSEFEYIYKKNNFTNKADYSRKSLEDYLNLYVNFRLKVKEATNQGLDNNDHFKDELSTYEKQLLDSYVEKDILEKLVKQEYERSKTDVNLSQIFFQVNGNDNEQAALQKAEAALKNIKSGTPFDVVAKSSDDKQSADKGGKVGWFNSYQMTFPEMEEVVYGMKVGDVSEPVRTRLGYHIIRLNETRPARPKIKVAIIKRFFPLGDTSDQSKKTTEDTIRMAYAKLKNGESFEHVVQQFSEDEFTKTNKGELEWFGINTYAKIFEETAYALKDGETSIPFRTSTAWYIIKRLQTAKTLSYEESVSVLKAKLQNLPQYQFEMDKFIRRAGDRFSIVQNKDNITAFRQRLTMLAQNAPFTYKDTTMAKVLMQIGAKTYDENDFGKKIQDIFYTVYPKAGADKYDELIKMAQQTFVIDYYKNDIRTNNAEYKSLMDEYRNGIMIFSLSENNIWNKASEDTVGLKAYYTEHSSDFNLKKRATIRKITADTDKQAKAIYKLLSSKPKISDDSLMVEMKKIGIVQPKISIQVADETKTKLNINAESLSLPKLSGNKYELTQVYNLQGAKARSFEECRGYVVAAYQEYLEKKWLAELRLKYPVVINKDVFETLVKK